jgi:DNA modification methylase
MSISISGGDSAVKTPPYTIDPYYTRDGITIYHGDVRAVLAALIAAGVTADLIASDVAYECISGGAGPSDNWQKPSGIIAANDGKIFDHNDIETADYARLFFDLLRDPGHCYIFINTLNLIAALVDFSAAGFALHNTITWDKGSATPNRWYMKRKEDILFFRKGAAFTINNPGAANVMNYPPVPKDKKLHPTEKPPLLMQELVTNSSQPGELVIDPFMGSGSTGEACWRTKRRFIGIDIDKRYCEIAARRFDTLIDGAPIQLSLLEATP